MTISPGSISTHISKDLKQSVFFVSEYFHRYPREIEYHLAFLMQIPLVCQLLDQVKHDIGKINIDVIDLDNIHAFWDVDQRTIFISVFLIKETQEKIVSILLFEFFNAAKSELLRQVVFNKSSIEERVCEIEKLEHDSALQTRDVLSVIYPENENEFTNIYDDFRLHYIYQQISGHSEWLAKKISGGSASFKGTLNYPIEDLSERDKNVIQSLFYSHIRGFQCGESFEVKEFYRKIEILKKVCSSDATYAKALNCALFVFQNNF